MIEASASNADKMRYRVYYRLMDICLIGYVVAIVLNILDQTVLINLEDTGRLGSFLIRVATGLLTYVLGAFLVLAWFMRDEYAELLWRRTASMVVYFVTITPFVLFTAAWLTFAALQAEQLPESWEWMLARPPIAGVVTFGFGLFIFAFVSVFQFLRWRDSR
ncbi:hypothetical protein [Aurantiacibacter sp. MUD61]|uniref:hypothetical protein n=1 Tax=Aurantiacibacter sp. MUD61 TaxID=3009083 RepID=UPI0022F127FA|nr:hypothetical protein [Aurantiacibacter sp. MUD61]